MQSTYEQRSRTLLDSFIDTVVQIERRCPSIKRKPDAKTRTVPADLIDKLRKLADMADNLLCGKEAKHVSP